ncbi:MAG: hypothetical protein ABFS56_22585 [Pseudomonadota bacterium]
MHNRLKTGKERIHVTVPALIRLSQNAQSLLPLNATQQSGQYLSPFKGR